MFFIVHALKGDAYASHMLRFVDANVTCEKYGTLLHIMTQARFWTPEHAHRSSQIVYFFLGRCDLNAVDAHGNTVLQASIENVCQFIFQQCIKLQVDVNHQNHNGVTALMVAAMWPDSPFFFQLLSTPGIDVNVIDNFGRNALFYVCDDILISPKMYCNSSYTQCLLQEGCRVTLQDGGGNSLLHYLLRSPYDDDDELKEEVMDTFECLLEAGICKILTCCNNDGQTALDVMAASGCDVPTIRDTLLKAKGFDHCDADLQEQCCICMEMSNHKTILTKCCGHMFHLNCFKEWMDRRTRPTCPLCRAILPGTLG